MVQTPGAGGRPGNTAPRTRGDGPSGPSSPCPAGGCSPHPRGWSLRARTCARTARLLPAPAGMVPTSPTRRPTVVAAPRTRGDGPAAVGEPLHGQLCSPHPRGWSQRDALPPDRHPLLPAPAGMVPGWPVPCGPGGSAPRTRGDGPPWGHRACQARVCSPHPRGWSRLGTASGGDSGRDPVHAQARWEAEVGEEGREGGVDEPVRHALARRSVSVVARPGQGESGSGVAVVAAAASTVLSRAGETAR